MAATTTELKSESLGLLQAYRLNPTTALRNRLVQLNMGLVRREVQRWSLSPGGCWGLEAHEDLLQVGCMGLMRAVERFDPTKGHAFSSFAMPYIRGEIQHHLRDKSPQVRIPRRWQDLQRQATAASRQLREELKRQPTDREIATALDISDQEWQQVKLAAANQSLLSLDAPLRDEEQGTTSLAELMPDGHYRSFQLAQEDRIRLQQALASLEQRTCQILEFVFLYDLTQKETAEMLGISAVTVSRQVKKGLSALNKLMKGSDDA